MQNRRALPCDWLARHLWVVVFYLKKWFNCCSPIENWCNIFGVLMITFGHHLWKAGFLILWNNLIPERGFTMHSLGRIRNHPRHVFTDAKRGPISFKTVLLMFENSYRLYCYLIFKKKYKIADNLGFCLHFQQLLGMKCPFRAQCLTMYQDLNSGATWQRGLRMLMFFKNCVNIC